MCLCEQGTYSVVVFRDENKVEVIPSTWLFNNKTLCFWPVEKSKVTSYVNRYQPPDVDKWLMYTNITELGVYGIYFNITWSKIKKNLSCFTFLISYKVKFIVHFK